MRGGGTRRAAKRKRKATETFATLAQHRFAVPYSYGTEGGPVRAKHEVWASWTGDGQFRRHRQ